MTNNIIDQLLFLQDVLNIQVPCVNDYLKDVLIKDFFLRYCYEVIQPDNSMVALWENREQQPLIQLRTSLFLLSSVLNSMKEISLLSAQSRVFLHSTPIFKRIFFPCFSLSQTTRMRCIVLAGKTVLIPFPDACHCIPKCLPESQNQPFSCAARCTFRKHCVDYSDCSNSVVLAV